MFSRAQIPASPSAGKTLSCAPRPLSRSPKTASTFRPPGWLGAFSRKKICACLEFVMVFAAAIQNSRRSTCSLRHFTMQASLALVRMGTGSRYRRGAGLVGRQEKVRLHAAVEPGGPRGAAVAVILPGAVPTGTDAQRRRAMRRSADTHVGRAHAVSKLALRQARPRPSHTRVNAGTLYARANTHRQQPSSRTTAASACRQ